MYRFLFLTIFFLSTQFAQGQACGIYRIEFVGNIAQTNKELVNVYLPTTVFLHGIVKETSEDAFFETSLTNESFKIGIVSHLTTPLDNINQLLSLYKEKSIVFKMKVSFVENDSIHERILEINWDKIVITIIEDEKFGTLFQMTLADLSLNL